MLCRSTQKSNLAVLAAGGVLVKKASDLEKKDSQLQKLLRILWIWNLQGKFFCATANHFVTSCWSDIQNCGKTMISVRRELGRTSLTCFIHFCARRCSEARISKFLIARRCSETHILIFLDEPSRRIRWVDRAKL